MGKIENIKLRKIRNEHFIRAFEHVARCLSMTQGELAKAIGTKTAYISNFRKGLRPVTEEAIDGLIRISATKPGLKVFSEYLYGNSDIMLLDNVSDEEMVAAKMRHDNPDYDKIEKQKAASPATAEPAANIPDYASLINATISAQMESIESLKRELLTKDDLIQSLRDQLADKEQLIAEQKACLIDYRRIIDSKELLSDYPFPIGVAEQDKRKPAHK